MRCSDLHEYHTLRHYSSAQPRTLSGLDVSPSSDAALLMRWRETERTPFEQQHHLWPRCRPGWAHGRPPQRHLGLAKRISGSDALSDSFARALSLYHSHGPKDQARRPDAGPRGRGRTKHLRKAQDDRRHWFFDACWLRRLDPLQPLFDVSRRSHHRRANRVGWSRLWRRQRCTICLRGDKGGA